MKSDTLPSFRLTPAPAASPAGITYVRPGEEWNGGERRVILPALRVRSATPREAFEHCGSIDKQFFLIADTHYGSGRNLSVRKLRFPSVLRSSGSSALGMTFRYGPAEFWIHW